MTTNETKQVAVEIRAMTLESAELAYRSLRDQLRENYQRIAGRQGRARQHEIAKLRGAGGHHADKSDRLEQELEQDNADYTASTARKSLLAVRTGRLVWYQVGSLRFSGVELAESTHGSGKFDNCGANA